MEAKVKEEYYLNTVTAFSGVEYVKGEWRKVPDKFEDQAIVHPFLDVREDDGKEIKVTSKDRLAEVMSSSSDKDASTEEAPEVTDDASEESSDSSTKTSRKKKK